MAWRLGCMLLAFPLVVGCSEPMYPVGGTVTFADKPVEEGIILLIPQEGPHGAREGKIVDGRFDLQAYKGKVRVEIRSMRQTGIGPMGPTYEDYIPRRYSTESTLTQEVRPGTNEWTFDLKANP